MCSELKVPAQVGVGPRSLANRPREVWRAGPPEFGGPAPEVWPAGNPNFNLTLHLGALVLKKYIHITGGPNKASRVGTGDARHVVLVMRFVEACRITVLRP